MPWEEPGTISDGPDRFRKAEAACRKHLGEKNKQKEWINNRVTNLDPAKVLRSSKPKKDLNHRGDGDKGQRQPVPLTWFSPLAGTFLRWLAKAACLAKAQ